MLPLHLLQIALVLVNTLMIQCALGEEHWANALGTDDLRALSPLTYATGNALSSEIRMRLQGIGKRLFRTGRGGYTPDPAVLVALWRRAFG